MRNQERSVNLGNVLRSILITPGAGVAVVLVLMCLAMIPVSRSFFSGNNWFNIVNQSVALLLVTLGETIVLIAGGIDLSVGATLGLTAGMMAFMVLNGVPFLVSLVLALAIGGAIGLINGLTITKLGLPPFVATLAMLGIGGGLLFFLTLGVPFVGYTDQLYLVLGGDSKLFWYITAPMVIAVGVSLIVAGVLRGTPFGRRVYGMGSNREAAQLSGVNVDRMTVYVYVLSGVLAATGGILLAGRLTTVEPTMGIGYEINAIAAAVIGGAALSGGRGSVLGAVLGALALTVVQAVINIANISSTWQTTVIGLMLLLAVVMNRGGTLLSERSRRSA